MEAVGRLAGGVAHDFNNILTAIMGNVSLILDDSTALAGPRQRAEEIRRPPSAPRTSPASCSPSARKQMFELQVVDLNTVITEMLKLLKVTVGDDIELVDRIAPQPGAVRVDPGQIEQVILNLVINARDAMPEGAGSRSRPRCSRRPRPTRCVSRRITSAGSSSWRCATPASGWTTKPRARIFEPFFTTKERGKGTGLRLATVYGIVRQSGGYISVHSERGRGSTFRVFLPAVDEPIDRPDPYRHKPGAELGAETVLVVEDEDLVRTLMCTSIARAGYRVIEARTGADALSLSGRFGGRIDLLLTDVVMPGMGGQELGERLLKARDGIKGALHLGVRGRRHRAEERAPERRRVPAEAVHDGDARAQGPRNAGRPRDGLTRGVGPAVRARPRGEADGVDDGVRTRDTWSHSPVLYQLSYIHHHTDDIPGTRRAGGRKVARLEGIEPPTDGLEIRCSIRLSYRRGVPIKIRPGIRPHEVGARGFEPPTPCSQSRCATGLRHAPEHNLEQRAG